MKEFSQKRNLLVATAKPPWTKEVHDILLSFRQELFIFAKDENWPPVKPGFLDLYSGKKGFAHAAVKLGAPWVLTIDINDGADCDLLAEVLRRKLRKLLENDVFIHFSAAPICASFSAAITPPVRSPSEPAGIMPLRSGMKQRILDGNSHSKFVASLVSIFICKSILYWVENPDSSYLWKQEEWINLPRVACTRFFRVDFCTFKTSSRRTRFQFHFGENGLVLLTSSRLANTKRLCSRDHEHVLLRGRSKVHKMAMTKLAEPYPRGLSHFLAWAACADLGLLKMSCSLSCKSDHRRIGEAKNPGPSRARQDVRNSDDLDNVALIRPETEHLGLTCWTNFIRWICETLGSDVIASLWLAPGLMGSMMAHYGRHLYEQGKALYIYRHLVVYAQRVYPGFKGSLQPAWNLIQRWEELEPVTHRRPLPQKMVEAMVSSALPWSWRRVAAIILICFHGCCRPGEALNACRGHLVLPIDLAQESGPSFLRIAKPKPGRRGMGRVQHAKIRCPDVVAFLSALYGDRNSTEKLYPGSHGSFRTRWNKLLCELGVPIYLDITPAGLRAGGTVHLYRSGVAILDILWALRLKNVETLQHYLQEISTHITMVDIPGCAKRTIQVSAEMFYFLLSTAKH